ncbi:unnamed protein product [Gadus morhua 'NCC']
MNLPLASDQRHQTSNQPPAHTASDQRHQTSKQPPAHTASDQRHQTSKQPRAHTASDQRHQTSNQPPAHTASDQRHQTSNQPPAHIDLDQRQQTSNRAGMQGSTSSVLAPPRGAVLADRIPSPGPIHHQPWSHPPPALVPSTTARSLSLPRPQPRALEPSLVQGGSALQPRPHQQRPPGSGRERGEKDKTDGRERDKRRE